MTFRTKLLIVNLIAALSVSSAGGVAFAVHDVGLFELDGNIANGAAAGDDWVNLHAGGGGAQLLQFIHIADGDSPTDTTYLRGGGSKDIHDFSEWERTTNDEAPDKDEIINAFAAAYELNGELYVAFAADRFAQNGTAQVGFWFVQDEVTISGASVLGEHEVGDILVLADFVNGGTVSVVRLFRWVGSGGSDGAIDEITPVGSADCGLVAAGDELCAIVNNEILTDLPWSYTPKAGTDGTYPVGGFFEGGVNLSELGVATSCFSSFIAETRTSHTPDARLKDIALGDFSTCASISGMKYEDMDADGTKDAGDDGLAGWEIHLFGEGEHRHATTDSAGAYSFESLEPGTYTVCETHQNGWTQSAPTTGADCSSHGGGTGYTVTADFGENATGNDFGNWQPATKSGMKFEDLDADGVKDEGEPGLEGWTIYVDADDDGELDQAEMSAVTASDGTYTITGITPGTYKVREVQQEGWSCSLPSPCHYEETFTSGAALTGNDFGNWRTATKSGTKFEDLDADGIRDEGEPGLAGWTIFVDYDGDGELDQGEPSAVTASDGSYLIGEVDPGTYDVREVQQEGWTCSYPSPCHYVETFTSGAGMTGNDFGNWAPGSVSGTKFEDLDADGERDEGEPGLAGWTIFVDYDGDGELDEGEPSAVTASDGSYTIDGVAPGSSTVLEVQQAGWSCSFPVPCEYAETFTSRADLQDRDFGNFRTATKSGTKWNDLDRDGVRDEGEPGLPDWEITLTGTSGAGASVSVSTVTDAAGNYSFTVPPGTYTVCEDLSGNPLWVQTHPAEGADCGEDGVGYEIVLASGVPEGGNDFGNFLPDPAIALTKTAAPLSGTPGTTITYTYVVENTGEVDLFDVVVTDDQLGQIGDPIEQLAVGETATLTATAVLGNAQIVNVAVVEGTDQIGRTVDATDDALVFPVLGEQIPRTGSDPFAGLETGMVLLGIGVALVGIARRRERHLLDQDSDLE